MAAENWQQVRDIFDVALRQKPEERTSFVSGVCGGDKTLLTEVESLLTSLDSAEGFMETPAIAKVAEQILTEQRQFSNGQFLNHYEIARLIGTGGMGEVYLATDTKLNRQVALKVLHPNLFSDNQANRRLVREAQAAAILDHPHICAIHEISETDEGSFIVMQYVEGETLADVLAERLTVEKSLDLAIQIADALSEAHAHSIIHRDIKPANIIVTEKGQAKVLDFGLAKFIEAESQEDTVKRLNSSGAVMGTVPYMSPEQLRGKRLDARTDIFSFGAMFYEMLSGQQAFAKESNAETISAILNDQPDWSRIPARLLPIVQKSLEKESDERYQTATDLTCDLRKAQQSGELLCATDRESDEPPRAETIPASPRETAGSKIPSYRFWKNSGPSVQFEPETDSFGNQQTIKSKTFRPGYPAIFAAFTIFLLLSAAGWLVWQLKTNTDSDSFDALRSVRLVSWKSGMGRDYGDFRVSNSGKLIALSSTQDGKSEAIYVKQAPEGEDIRVTKDEWTNHSPVWSPDDQRIAFVSIRDGSAGIYVSPSLGGPAVTLKVIGKGDISLRNWTADDAAIFYEHDGNLIRLDLESRETTPITEFAESPPNGRHFDLSPDEKQVVFVDDSDGQVDLWTMPLSGGASSRLTNDAERETRPFWQADGKRILYNVVRDNDMQIYRAFTDRRPSVQVTRGDGDYELVDISNDGTKVFYWFWENHSDISGVKIDTGEEFDLASQIESELWADASPDGKSIVYQTNDSPHLNPNLAKSSLVIKSLEPGSPPVGLKGHNPRWLPDSRHVAFMRWHPTEKLYQYWLVNAASGEEKQLTTSGVTTPSHGLLPNNRDDTGNNWSPDASHFAYLDSKKQNIWTTSVESSETSNLTGNTNANLRYYPPVWSPDGRLIAFLSMEKAEKPKWSGWFNERGKTREIYTTMAELRLLGFSASGHEILLAMTDGFMVSSPLNVKILQVSENGDSRVLTIFKSIYASSLTLSSDSKMLAFTARLDDKDNIWLASANGGEAKKITANGNSKTFYGSPAWSADGKIVYFDKQDQINTISMFENFK
jgi:serine/threonine protein kinase